MMPSRKAVLFALVLASATGCDGTTPVGTNQEFLQGTPANPEIGIVVNTTGKAITMFQVGAPDQQRQIALGTSDLITPVNLSIHGTHAIVPLGQAASVALVDLEGEQVSRYFTFPSGNATGSAWVDDNTFVAANLVGGYIGQATLSQPDDEISTTVDVAPAPTAIVVSGGRAFVISSNYDENYVSLGNGVVTAVDLATMTVIDGVETGGTNATAAAMGPDGKLYVLNTGDYIADASVTIINPMTLAVESTVSGFPAGAGSIRIENDGLAYVSSWSAGTVVWNTATHKFVRGLANLVCAGNPCRGAFDADRAPDGWLYQAFIGSATESPYVFVYAPGTYTLVDSIPAGVGISSIDIARFR